jgi:glycosyltransferase involved in cell wall biosynthesis
MGKVRLIHRGVDPDEFPCGYQPSSAWLDDWYKQYPQLKDNRVLTLPGRLSRSKGHYDFLYLLLSLKKQGQKYHGLIVGDAGPRRKSYTKELRKLVTDLELDEDVTFTGSHNDMRDIYAASDLVLSLSSKPESFGRTVVESLSIGTPVVGYDHGGVSEIMQELFPMGLVPVKDGTALSNRVQAVLGQQSVTIKENHFLLQDMLDKTINCYEELLMNKQAQHASV